jgi:hypothetical protein
MSNNLEIWNLVSHPPASALKEIAGGKLRGKTDINPQWRIKAMTEAFGMIGFGWKYMVVRDWSVPGANGEIMLFVEIALHVKHGGEWSEPIHGIGGNYLINTERGSLVSNDEAYKMATTDALSVAMKQLGVASSIYEGMWDGSKYKDTEPVRKENGTLVGKGVVSGTTGVFESLSTDTQTVVIDTAKEIDAMAKVDIKKAIEIFKSAYINDDGEVDNEIKIAIWSKLGSQVRSKIKEHGDGK